MRDLFLSAQLQYLTHLFIEARSVQRSVIKILVYVKSKVKLSEEVEPVDVDFAEKGFIKMPNSVLHTASLHPALDAGMTVLLSVGPRACPDLRIDDGIIKGSMTVGGVPTSFEFPLEFLAAVMVNDFGVMFDTSLYLSKLAILLSDDSDLQNKTQPEVKRPSRPSLTVVK